MKSNLTLLPNENYFPLFKYRFFRLLATLAVITGMMLPSLQAQITSYPYLTDFETEPLCGTSCGSACALTGGWKNAGQVGLPAGGTTWRSEDGSTPSTDTGPDVDHTLGTASGKYLYVETSGCNNLIADLISPQFDFTALSQPAVEFYYHMYGATMGTIQVDVSTDGGTTFAAVEAPFTDHENLWQNKLISLSAYAGMPNVRLRIRAVTGTSFTSDMAIDDVNVFDCSVPTIALTTVEISSNNCQLDDDEFFSITITNTGCTPVPSGASIDFSYTLNSGSPVSVTQVLSSAIQPNDSYVFTFSNSEDLTGGGAQVVSAFATLAGNTSTFNKTFYTGVASFPYMQDFESGPAGWTVRNLGNVPTSWELGTPAKPTINSAHSGSNAWITKTSGNYIDSENGAVQSPCLDMRNLLDAQISMWIWWNCEFSWDGAVLQSSLDEGFTWQNVGAFGDPNNWYTDNSIVGVPGGSQEGWSGRDITGNSSNGWVLASHDISHLVGQSPVYLRIAFGTDGSIVDDGFAFDDISITGTPACTSPVALCKPYTATLDVNGNATVLASDVDDGSTVDCGPATLSVSPGSFTCAQTGAQTVTLTVTDNANSVSSQCTATVTVEGPCAVPTNLITTNLTETTATIGWTGLPCVSGYRTRYRAQSSNGNWGSWTNWTTTLAMSRNLTGLTKGTNYQWQVMSRCGNQFSAAVEGSFTTLCNNPCLPPTGLATTAITSTSATVKWTAHVCVPQYQVRYRYKINATTWSGYTDWVTTSAASLPLTGLLSGKSYQWQVAAACTAGWTAPSTGNFTTPAAAGIAPAGQSVFEMVHTVTLQPNPASLEVRLVIGQPFIVARTTISDLNGKSLFSSDWTPGAAELRLSLEKFAAGFYFVQTVVDGQFFTEKLMVIQ